MSEALELVREANPRRFRPYPEYKNSRVEWLGEIPAHWEVSRMKHVARLESGHTPSRQHPEYWQDCTIPWFGLADVWQIRDGHTEYVLETAEKVSELGLAHSAARLLPKGTVILSRTASVGFSAIMGVDMATTQDFVNWVCGPRLRPEYMLSVFRSMGQEFRRLRMGSTHQTIYMPDVGKFSTPVPPISEQDQIVEFIRGETAKIDALVAKKERLIELLQEKRYALVTRAVTRGLDPNVPMKDSGVEWLGEIPAHWEMYQLKRVISKFVDYRGKTPEKSRSGVALITAKNIKNQAINFSLSEEFIPEDLYSAWMVRGFPEEGDVLVTTEAPLGESAQINYTNIALAQRIILLKANKKRITNDYLKYHFAGDSGRLELRTRATGSTAVGIKASHLKATLITVPPLTEQKEISRAIDNVLEEVDSLVAKVRDAIELLMQFRSALISAAVTGKIDVREETA